MGFAGLVLAGGASSRMGRDKALLLRHGRTLLEQAVQRLQAAGADPVLVSGDRPAYDSVPDEEPGLGPLGGLNSVIRARPGLMGRLLVVTPVDVPGLTADALRELAAQVVGNTTGACFENHPLPLAVRVTPSLQESIAALLADGGPSSVRRLNESLAVTVVKPGTVDLRNVNTPREWERFREIAG